MHESNSTPIAKPLTLLPLEIKSLATTVSCINTANQKAVCLASLPWKIAGACTCIPASEKSSECTRKALQHFFGPGTKPKILYSDCSKELKKACNDLDFLADTSTPHRPQSNGVAERCQRRVKEGTRCVLKQSGLTQTGGQKQCGTMHSPEILTI